MPDLDLLRPLGDQLVPPPLDALRETARRRDRRAAAAAAVACAVAVLVVVSTTGLLGGSGRGRTAPPPAETPGVARTTRPITYADGAILHYGDRTIEHRARWWSST